MNSSRAPVNPNADQRGLDVLSEQAWYNQALFVDPGNPDAVFIGGQRSMIRSLDAGRTWYVLSDWLPHNSENSNRSPHSKNRTNGMRKRRQMILSPILRLL